MTLRALPLALTALLTARTAHADPPVAELAWAREESAARCPDGEALRAEVQERLRRGVFGDGAPRVIEGVARRDGATWTARLVVRDRQGTALGERELSRTGDDCDALADAVALAVTLAIDPEYVPPAVPRPRRIRRVRAAPREVPPVPTPAPATTYTEVGLAIVAVMGVVPVVAPVFGGDVLVPLHPRWHLALGATWTPATNDVSIPARLGATLALLGACGTIFEGSRFAFRGCAGVHAGAIHLAVRPEATPGDVGDHPWIAVYAGVRASVRLVGPLTLGAVAGASFPLRRNTFIRDPAGDELYTQSPVGVSATLNLGIRMP